MPSIRHNDEPAARPLGVQLKGGPRGAHTIVPPLNDNRGDATSLENRAAFHELIVVLKPASIHEKMALDPRKSQRKSIILGCALDVIWIDEEARGCHFVHRPRTRASKFLRLVLTGQAAVIGRNDISTLRQGYRGEKVLGSIRKDICVVCRVLPATVHNFVKFKLEDRRIDVNPLTPF